MTKLTSSMMCRSFSQPLRSHDLFSARFIASALFTALLVAWIPGYAQDSDVPLDDPADALIPTEGVNRTPMHAAARSGFADYISALEFAENAFAFGDYRQVIRVLTPWLMPSPVDATTARNRADGYGWLAAAAWFENRPMEAREVLRTGLRVDPSMALDPLIFPPELVQFYREVREEMQPELTEISDNSGDNVVYIESRVVEHSIWVSMIPFGYGMFANGRSDWGIAYAFTEVSLLAVTTGLFWANYAERRASDDPRNPLGYPDPNRAALRRRIHVATGWALLGVITANVLHGALTHERAREVQYRTLTGPPDRLDERIMGREPQSKARRWSVLVYPTLELGAPRRPHSLEW